MRAIVCVTRVMGTLTVLGSPGSLGTTVMSGRGRLREQPVLKPTWLLPASLGLVVLLCCGQEVLDVSSLWLLVSLEPRAPQWGRELGTQMPTLLPSAKVRGAAPYLLQRVCWGGGLSCGSQVCRPVPVCPPVLPPLIIPTRPLSKALTCGSLWHPCVLSGGGFVGLLTSGQLRLEKRHKGVVSLYHSTDVPGKVLSLTIRKEQKSFPTSKGSRCSSCSSSLGETARSKDGMRKQRRAVLHNPEAFLTHRLRNFIILSVRHT